MALFEINWRSLVELVFPARCLSCGVEVQSGKVICEKCFPAIRFNQTLFCGRCRARMAISRRICHPNFPYILGAAGNYSDETLKNLIHEFKFRSVKQAAGFLGGLLADYARGIPFPWRLFLVMPVPLSKKRERKRGFNQSEMIAEVFAKNLGLPIETKVLRRHKNAKPQSEIQGWERRRENVRNCFSVTAPAALKGKNVILIDDVTTSGATLLEAAVTLKKCGVRRIVGLVVAKA